MTVEPREHILNLPPESAFAAAGTLKLTQNGSGHGPSADTPPTASLPEKTIDDIRPLKVAVIGAGISGVLAGILLPAKVPKIELTIFEKNAEVVSTRGRTVPR
jgi:hypothetical protein